MPPTWHGLIPRQQSVHCTVSHTPLPDEAHNSQCSPPLCLAAQSNRSALPPTLPALPVAGEGHFVCSPIPSEGRPVWINSSRTLSCNWQQPPAFLSSHPQGGSSLRATASFRSIPADDSRLKLIQDRSPSSAHQFASMYPHRTAPSSFSPSGVRLRVPAVHSHSYCVKLCYILLLLLLLSNIQE